MEDLKHTAMEDLKHTVSDKLLRAFGEDKRARSFCVKHRRVRHHSRRLLGLPGPTGIHMLDARSDALGRLGRSTTAEVEERGDDAPKR
jgi:hypothetical protein